MPLWGALFSSCGCLVGCFGGRDFRDSVVNWEVQWFHGNNKNFWVKLTHDYIPFPVTRDSKHPFYTTWSPTRHRNVSHGLLSVALGIFYHSSYQEKKKSLSNLCYLVGKTLVESSPCLVPYHLTTLSLTCLTELNRCSVDDSGAIMWMEYAELSTHPGQTGPSVSLERQVAPQSVILSWGSRNGQNVGRWLSHRCLECKLMQCVLTCVVFWGGTGSTLLLKIVKTDIIA